MSSFQSGPISGNNSKFPFILVPVSPATSEDNNSCKVTTNCPRSSVRKQVSDDTNPSRPISSQGQHLNPKKSDNNNNNVTIGSSKRAAALQRQLNAQFSPIPSSYPTLLQTFSAHDQLRRPARFLYPSASSTITSVTSDRSNDDLNPGPIIYNGVRLTEENYREILQAKPLNNPNPNQVQRNRQSKTTRAGNPSTTVNTATVPQEFQSPVQNRKSRIDLFNSEESKLKKHCLPAESGDYCTENFKSDSSPSLQVQVDSLVNKLRVKDFEISVLREELSKVKKSVENSKSGMLNDSKSCCQSFKKGLAKVEKQLENLEDKVDFGDGDFHRRSLGLLGLGPSKKSYAQDIILDQSPSLLFSPDFDRIIRSTRELNSCVGHESVELCYNSGGATFKQSQSITLTLYKNGLILDDAPQNFKSFSNPTTHQLVQDIYDGYFPSELQAKYPDGISLIVEDKRGVIYSKEGVLFAGEGKKLSEPYRKQIVPKFIPGMKYKPVDCSSLLIKVTSKESLSSLKSDTESCYEELPELIPNHLKSFHASKPGNKNMITLKLKNMIKGSLYKFRANIYATIENLLDHLDENLYEDDKCESDDERAELNGLRKYELINILPFGTFAIVGTSLKDYGIISNTLLYFRPT